MREGAVLRIGCAERRNRAEVAPVRMFPAGPARFAAHHQTAACHAAGHCQGSVRRFHHQEGNASLGTPAE